MEKNFYGRQHELRQLSRIFTNSYPKDACLLGPPGIGKRTLLEKAKEKFFSEPHKDMLLVERTFLNDDTSEKFFSDTLIQLHQQLNNAVWDGFLSRDILNEILSLPEKNNLLYALEKTLEKLKAKKVPVKIVFIFCSFESLIGTDKHDRSAIISFLDKISSNNVSAMNVNVLLVSDTDPKVIADPVIHSGSRFGLAYKNIPLHCFDNEQMKQYFADFPQGTPDITVQNAVLKHLGRYPSLLCEFRDFLDDGQPVTVKQVLDFADNLDNSSLFHRLCTLMCRHFVNRENTISCLNTARDYFTGGSSSGSMADVYKFGLVDKTNEGNYTPLTEYLTSEEFGESKFLKYLTGGTAQSAKSSLPSDTVISWLHLSDLHVSEEFDTTMLMEQYKKLAEVIHPSFLVVTGDFRDKAANTKFDLAREFLEKILTIFHLSKEDVFMIPGNHDCENADTYMKRRIKKITTAVDSNYAVINNHINDLYERFGAYDSLCKDFYAGYPNDERFKNPSRTHLLNYKNKLQILCINTALISDGDRNHKDITDPDGITNAMNNRNTRIPTIMIGHHAMEAIYPSIQSRVKTAMQNYQISAYLHGDTHKSGSESVIPTNLDEQTPSISCGKSTPKSGDNYSDVGAVYYEWKNDNRVYVRWYKWYHSENPHIFKLDEDRNNNAPIGKYLSFAMKIPNNTA